jgi:purine-nucleoside phosphorylase
MVGMSTVPEAIAARYLGMKVLGISCITNMAAGVLDAPLDHSEVMERGKEAAPRFSRLLLETIRKLGGRVDDG